MVGRGAIKTNVSAVSIIAISHVLVRCTGRVEVTPVCELSSSYMIVNSPSDDFSVEREWNQNCGPGTPVPTVLGHLQKGVCSEIS